MQLSRFFAGAFLPLLLLAHHFTQLAQACDWDYPIWMIRSKNADPLFRFMKNGKAGYINASGKVVIEPRFRVSGNRGGEFFDGLMGLADDGRYYDVTGEVVLETGFYRGWNFSEGLAAALRTDEDKWGYINTSGSFVISPRFETYPKGHVWSFHEGLAKIKIGSKIGYIDRTGDFVIQPRFLEGRAFSEGRAWVVLEGPPCLFTHPGPCGDLDVLPENAVERQALYELIDQIPPCQFSLIDRFGNIVSKNRFEEPGNFSEGRAAVSIDGKRGFVDRAGQLVVEPRFFKAEPYSSGFAKVVPWPRPEESWEHPYGYIDRAGDFSIEPRYTQAESFSDGLAAVKGSDGLYYYINGEGREPVVLHSDRGCQFTSSEYQRFLKAHNLVCSMSAVGSYADNAVVEGFFGLIKRERINRRNYRTQDQARSDIFDYIERFHNPRKRRALERSIQEEALFSKPSVESG